MHQGGTKTEHTFPPDAQREPSGETVTQLR